MACKRLLIALAVALAACGSEPKHIDVSGKPGDLRFTLMATEGASQACARNLSVTPVVPEDAYPTWQVSSLGTGKCFGTLRYGQVSPDVTQKTPAIPLRPDIAYRVSIWGPGFSVVRDFRLTGNGVKMQD